MRLSNERCSLSRTRHVRTRWATVRFLFCRWNRLSGFEPASRDPTRCEEPPSAEPNHPSLERLGCADLDAEAGEPDIRARTGRQQLYRRNPQIAQDLRPESHLAPLDVALVFPAGPPLGNQTSRHPRCAVQ